MTPHSELDGFNFQEGDPAGSTQFERYSGKGSGTGNGYLSFPGVAIPPNFCIDADEERQMGPGVSMLTPDMSWSKCDMPAFAWFELFIRAGAVLSAGAVGATNQGSNFFGWTGPVGVVAPTALWENLRDALEQLEPFPSPQPVQTHSMGTPRHHQEDGYDSTGNERKQSGEERRQKRNGQQQQHHHHHQSSSLSHAASNSVSMSNTMQPHQPHHGGVNEDDGEENYEDDEGEHDGDDEDRSYLDVESPSTSLHLRHYPSNERDMPSSPVSSQRHTGPIHYPSLQHLPSQPLYLPPGARSSQAARNLAPPQRRLPTKRQAMSAQGMQGAGNDRDDPQNFHQQHHHDHHDDGDDDEAPPPPPSGTFGGHPSSGHLYHHPSTPSLRVFASQTSLASQSTLMDDMGYPIHHHQKYVSGQHSGGLIVPMASNSTLSSAASASSLLGGNNGRRRTRRRAKSVSMASLTSVVSSSSTLNNMPELNSRRSNGGFMGGLRGGMSPAPTQQQVFMQQQHHGVGRGGGRSGGDTTRGRLAMSDDELGGNMRGEGGGGGRGRRDVEEDYMMGEDDDILRMEEEDDMELLHQSRVGGYINNTSSTSSHHHHHHHHPDDDLDDDAYDHDHDPTIPPSYTDNHPPQTLRMSGPSNLPHYLERIPDARNGSRSMSPRTRNGYPLPYPDDHLHTSARRSSASTTSTSHDPRQPHPHSTSPAATPLSPSPSLPSTASAPSPLPSYPPLVALDACSNPVQGLSHLPQSFLSEVRGVFGYGVVYHATRPRESRVFFAFRDDNEMGEGVRKRNVKLFRSIAEKHNVPFGNYLKWTEALKSAQNRRPSLHDTMSGNMRRTNTSHGRSQQQQQQQQHVQFVQQTTGGEGDGDNVAS